MISLYCLYVFTLTNELPIGLQGVPLFLTPARAQQLEYIATIEARLNGRWVTVKALPCIDRGKAQAPAPVRRHRYADASFTA